MDLFNLEMAIIGPFNQNPLHSNAVMRLSSVSEIVKDMSGKDSMLSHEELKEATVVLLPG